MSPKMPLIRCAWHPAWLPTTISGYLWESSDHPVGFLRLLVLSLGKLIFAPLLPGKTCRDSITLRFARPVRFLHLRAKSWEDTRLQLIITKPRVTLVWENLKRHFAAVSSNRRHQTDTDKKLLLWRVVFNYVCICKTSLTICKRNFIPPLDKNKDENKDEIWIYN